MKNPTIRAVIYARISQDAEQDGLGVSRQTEDCQARATRDNLTVIDSYVDNDISASTIGTKRRPEYDRLLKDARAGRFDVVLAYSNSRLTRRPRELEDLIDLHDKHKTRFLTIVSGDDDLSSADGRMVARLKATIDAAEAERSAERVRRKMKQLAEDGRHIGSRPFGWDIIGTGKDQKLTVNDAEAVVLRECVERAINGDSIWKITNDLNARGILTSKGNPWKTQVLRRVLLRDRNVGYRLHQPLKNGKPHGKAMRYPGQWELIIDEETHDRVVAKLTDPSRRTNNRGTSPKYLLTSIARCGECGGYLVGIKEHSYEIKSSYVRKDGSRGPSKQRVYAAHYKCPAVGCMKVTRQMKEMDGHVTRVVLDVLRRDGVKLLGGDPVAAKSARELISGLEAKLALAADQWADGGLGMTDDQLRRVNETLRPQLDAEHARLAAAQPSSGFAEFAEFAGQDIADAWEDANIETRKEILRVLQVLLGLQITAHRIGSGNGNKGYAPDSVSVTWPEPADRDGDENAA